MEVSSRTTRKHLPRAGCRSSGRNSRGWFEEFHLPDRRSAVRSATTGARQLRCLQPALHTCIVSRVLQVCRKPSGLPMPWRFLLGRRRLRTAGPTPSPSSPHSTRTARFRSGCLGHRRVLARRSTIGAVCVLVRRTARCKAEARRHSTIRPCRVQL